MSDHIAIDQLTSTFSTAYVQSGTVYQNPENGKEYRFVKNQATDAATVSHPVCYRHVDPHDNEWEITADITDCLVTDVPVGFAGVPETTIPAGEYGWILREGVYESCKVNGTVTAGDVVKVSTADGYFADRDGAGDHTAGVAMEAVATSDSVGVTAIFIKGL